MEAALNLEACVLTDLEDMDFPFNYMNSAEEISYYEGIQSLTSSLNETFFRSLDSACQDLGYYSNKEPNFYQPNYDVLCPQDHSNIELNDCLYNNSLEPTRTWTTLSLPPVQFDSQFTHTLIQEPLPNPEYMDIREVKTELTKPQPYTNTSEKPQRRKPGRKKGQLSNVYHLWEFIRDLLKDPHHKHLITWEDKDKGIFRMIKSGEVAKLWGQRKKNKLLMNYEKMSRSLRYSRKEGYFMEIPRDGSYPKKLCFRFGPKSHGWK